MYQLSRIFRSSFVQGLVGGILGGALIIWVMSPWLGDNIINTIETEQKLTLSEDSAVIEAVNKVSPSVVNIVSNKNVVSIFGGVYEQVGGGTGFVIRDNGLIVTNRHVVSDEQADYTVVTSGGENYKAQVVAKDPFNDLAVVKIDASGLTVAELGDSDALVVGQKVVAIGNALGEYQNTVTAGVVSAVNRVIVAGDGEGMTERLEGVIQTDAGINPGNSGGPLVNMAGQVIGINTAIDQDGREISFAIPVNSVKSAIESVLSTGSIKRPMLGIRYIHITKEFAALNNMEIEQGALVIRGDGQGELAVIPGGPADLAGIKENDIILSIDGKEITEDRGIINILRDYQPGDIVEVKVYRSGQEYKFSLRLGELES